MTTLPSHIVEAINSEFPSISDNTSLNSPRPVAALGGILSAIRAIPQDLIPVASRTVFLTTVGALESAIASCSPDIRRGRLTGRYVRDVLQLLESLPDEAVLADDTTLAFIDDSEYRLLLSGDVAAAHQALRNGEWKAATVLAGSVVEGLCLWAIRKAGEEKAFAEAERLHSGGVVKSKQRKHLLEWQAGELIAVAASPRLIKEDARAVAVNAKDYRNLIHPGRELRSQQRCTSGTAHVAVGGMQRVIEDLDSASRSTETAPSSPS